MSNSAMSQPGSMVSNSNLPSAPANSMFARRLDEGETKTAAAPEENRYALDGVAASKPAEPTGGAQPPPPPVTADITSTEKDEKKAEDKEKLRERGRDLELASRKESDDSRTARDAPAAAAKAGPARSGPYQTKSNQAANQVFDMPVTRIVGGRSFNNRNGAWYDTAYHGQATIDVRRGSSEFKKLDGGLKSIANNLNGVVVVVWKAKANRIQ
jgi:hypothetical protein